MKRLLIIITFALLAIITKAQIATCAYYDGYWGEWRNWDYVQPYRIYGNYSGFIIYDKEDHPSQYVFKFQINNYTPPTRKQIKEHYKREEWYVYSGIVEYYVTENEPTIKDILKQNGFPIYHKDTYDKYGNYAVKRVANATIKIAPYKKHPRVYNLWFDDVAVGISLVNLQFNI